MLNAIDRLINNSFKIARYSWSLSSKNSECQLSPGSTPVSCSSKPQGSCPCLSEPHGNRFLLITPDEPTDPKILIFCQDQHRHKFSINLLVAFLAEICSSQTGKTDRKTKIWLQIGTIHNTYLSARQNNAFFVPRMQAALRIRNNSSCGSTHVHGLSGESVHAHRLIC